MQYKRGITPPPAKINNNGSKYPLPYINVCWFPSMTKVTTSSYSSVEGITQYPLKYETAAIQPTAVQKEKHLSHCSTKLKYMAYSSIQGFSAIYEHLQQQYRRGNPVPTAA